MPNGKSMLERTVAYSITMTRIGTSRKVPTVLIETDAERSLLRISKRILECEEVQEIRRLDWMLRRFVRARCVDYPLKPGIHLIPAVLVEEVDAEVERVRPIRQKLVDLLASRVDELKTRDETALGSLFNAADYPTPEQVRVAFELQTRYLALDLPGNLANVSRAVFERESVRVRQEIADAAEAVRQVQRLQMMELVQGLLDRLTPAEGKKRIIRSASLDNVTEFLDRYGKLNVADDTELVKIVDQAKQILSGVDCESLRSNDAAAQTVKEGMAQVQAAIAPLIVDAPRRKFRVQSETE